MQSEYNHESSRDNRCPGRKLNEGPSEYEAELLVILGLYRGINEIFALLGCYAA
jgi:hypothetical protein